MREFLIAKTATIDEDFPPSSIKATHGSLWAFSRNNFKKKIRVEIEKKSDEKSLLTVEISHFQANVLCAISAIITILITVPLMMIPYVGFVFFFLFGIPMFAIIIWSFTGRGKFEEDFWQYFETRIPSIKNTIKSPIFGAVGKSEEELKKRLQEIEDELIGGKITESEYKKLKKHVEIELEDIVERKKSAQDSRTK